MESLGSLWRSLTQGGGDAAEGRRLLEAIHAALAAGVRARGVQALSAAELAPIKALCDQLLPAHFQLKVPPAEDAAADADGPKSVHYQHIYEDETFSMGIFILSPGASLPLHDHPGMSVVSRLLYGSLRVRAFDLVDAAGRPVAHAAPAAPAAPGEPRIARLRSDAVLSAPHTTDLAPDRGNLHEFVAGGDRGCAIFDILTPPYDERAGRDCTYYREARGARGPQAAAGQLVTLEAFDPVFEVHSQPYHGPRLQRYVS